MIAQQNRARTLHGWQKWRVARKVRDAHGQLTGLARAEHFARAAQLQIFLGDAEAVVAFAQDVEALAC